MNDPMSDDKFARMFANPAAEKVANEPSTMERIQADFEHSFAAVKDRLGDSWQDVRTLYDMARDENFTIDGKVKIVVIGALAYLVSPVDLLPERVLGPIGLADDVAVLFFALKYAGPEIERYRKFKTDTAGDA